MRIHKEGKIITRNTLLILLSLNAIIYISFSNLQTVWVISVCVSLLLFLFVCRFFRVAIRPVEQNDSIVLSPADGTICAIEEVDENEYYNEKRIQVSVFMSVFNVHINWNPIPGIIKYCKYHQGAFLVASLPKASTDNERTTVVIENTKGSVLCRQIAGAVARRIVSYSKENAKVEQGSQMGFIKFGSRVDVFLPLNAKVKVKMNEKVTGNVTEIAEF